MNKAQDVLTSLDIRDIKPPVPISSLWLWVWIVLAAALAVAAIWWLLRRRRQRAAQPPLPTPPIPAHTIALRRLEHALTLIDQPKPYCFEISTALRDYLEARFDLHAPDRTTEEFLDELQSSPRLALAQKQLLGDFLQQCDLVKFAKYEPGRTELLRLHETAARLITETTPTASPLPA